jgi:hypothetical protein
MSTIPGVRIPGAGAVGSSLLAFVCIVSATGCRADRQQASNSPAAPGTPISQEWFVERAEASGLTFTHFNGMTGEFYEPEIAGPGVALFDADNDGDLDVFLVQGDTLGPSSGANPSAPTGRASPHEGRLFRNDLTVNADGTRTLRFTDITEQSGIRAHGYGMGVATGDFNNDGCTDLYITYFGRNQMYRNNCDGTFTDVSKQAGTESPGWSVSAAFVDYDRDGWLDLFVCHYLTYTLATDKKCRAWSGEPDYCAPNTYRPEQSRLYHNNRNGTFTDVTSTALIGGDYGPGLGVVTADFNGDGWIDIYVANDGQANQLWINQHDGTFKNTALLAGAALTGDGKATASMGVDAGDFDNDGDEDIFKTNLTGEGDTLYVNDGSGVFEDRTKRLGLCLPSLPYTGFGTTFIDFDNDGWLDVLTVNGTVRTLEGEVRAKDPFPFRQTKQLFRNLGGDRGFEDVTAKAGAVFRVPEVSRGAAFGDIDNDGDIDVVVANDNGPTRMLVNQIGNRNHWVGLRLIGGTTPRDMLGARVAVTRQDGVTIWRRARADASYGSANDPRVIVGLGSSTDPPKVRVIWPTGQSEEWSSVAVDRYTTLKQGTAR